MTGKEKDLSYYPINSTLQGWGSIEMFLKNGKLARMGRSEEIEEKVNAKIDELHELDFDIQNEKNSEFSPKKWKGIKKRIRQTFLLLKKNFKEKLNQYCKLFP